MSFKDERFQPENDLFSLSCEVLDLMTIELDKIVRDGTARCGLVVDRTGCVLASGGNFSDLSPYSMGAVAAATMAALNNLVSGSSPEVGVDFYNGKTDSILFVLVDDRLILTLLHSKNATGRNVRQAARQFVNKVLPQLRNDKRPTNSEETMLLESVNYIESKLDELFKDSLFDIK